MLFRAVVFEKATIELALQITKQFVQKFRRVLLDVELQ